LFCSHMYTFSDVNYNNLFTLSNVVNDENWLGLATF